MSVVRACIVGMGIGRPNGRAIEKNPRGSVVALCDLIPERMQDFAKEFDHDLKFYTDYHEMCQDPDIDAVFVGTPNQCARARGAGGGPERQACAGDQAAGRL